MPTVPPDDLRFSDLAQIFQLMPSEHRDDHMARYAICQMRPAYNILG